MFRIYTVKLCLVGMTAKLHEVFVARLSKQDLKKFNNRHNSVDWGYITGFNP